MDRWAFCRPPAGHSTPWSSTERHTFSYRYALCASVGYSRRRDWISRCSPGCWRQANGTSPPLRRRCPAAVRLERHSQAARPFWPRGRLRTGRRGNTGRAWASRVRLRVLQPCARGCTRTRSSRQSCWGNKAAAGRAAAYYQRGKIAGTELLKASVWWRYRPTRGSERQGATGRGRWPRCIARWCGRQTG